MIHVEDNVIPAMKFIHISVIAIFIPKKLSTSCRGFFYATAVVQYTIARYTIYLQIAVVSEMGRE